MKKKSITEITEESRWHYERCVPLRSIKAEEFFKLFGDPICLKLSDQQIASRLPNQSSMSLNYEIVDITTGHKCDMIADSPVTPYTPTKEEVIWALPFVT